MNLWRGVGSMGGDRSTAAGPPLWVIGILMLALGIVAAVAGDAKYSLAGFGLAVICIGLHFCLNALTRYGQRRSGTASSDDGIPTGPVNR